jgi:hypothetical protein
VKTYTIVVDGVPVAAFRARDDTEAVGMPVQLWGLHDSPFRDHKPKGEITTRPSTIAEREKWTRMSVPCEEAHDEEDEVDSSPDSLVPLVEDEEENAENG